MASGLVRNSESGGMTIRFTCAECASVLKIKDELAGTTGRCPKCKTKFVVPAAPSDERPSEDVAVENTTAFAGAAGSNSSEHQLSDNATATEQRHPVSIPASSHESESSEGSDVKIPMPLSASETLQPDFSPFTIGHSPLPADPDSSERLQLDDSDVRSDAIPLQLDRNEVSQEAPTVGPVVSDDDDDLDSPPVMISAVLPSHRFASIPNESMPDKKLQLASDGSTKSHKKTAQTSDAEPFDPMQFLMADQPASKRGSFPPSAYDEPHDLALAGDSDDDLRDRPTPHPLTRPTPAVATSRLTPEKMDLATAAKMMKKAIKDSQAEAAQQREMEARAGFDYAQFFREFGLRGLAVLVGGIVMTFGLYFAANRMFGSPLRLPKLGFVNGTVKLDGQPLSGALVYFSPMELEIAGTKRDRARTSVGETDGKGQFTMMYVPGDNIKGVAVGRCRVWVTHIGEKGSDVPSDWTEGAMLIKEIKEGSQKEPFDFVMESKTVESKKR